MLPLEKEELHRTGCINKDKLNTDCRWEEVAEVETVPV